MNGMISWYILFILLLVMSCIRFGLPREVVSFTRVLLTVDVVISVGLMLTS